MPSTYAHYRFGKEVEKLLPDELSRIVSEHEQLFDIGLHGPDILFYYKPLRNNRVNAVGYAMHEKPACVFFQKAEEIYLHDGNPRAAAAYLVGFVCHYALDSACHGYIEKKISVSRLAHAMIENEFDRILIAEDGKNLKDVDLCAHIRATDENAAVIAPFFGVAPEQVKKALKSMKFYNRLLVGNRAWKRGFVNFCLRISGNYRTMKGCVICKKPIKECEDSNQTLKRLFISAKDRCCVLEKEFWNYLNGGELTEDFSHTFGAEEGWGQIEL